MKGSTLRADPSVAAVVPCCNDGRFLRRAVSSLRQQSAALREIVLVDDGSTDTETIELMDELSREEGIRLIRFSQNRGPSAARNAGIASVEVDYILLLDADDSHEPTFLEKALQRYASYPGRRIVAVGCYMNIYRKNESGAWFRPYIREFLGGRLPAFLLSNQCHASPLLCKAAWEEVGGYDEQMRYAEDWDFWIRITAADWQIDILPLLLYNYYQHKSSTSWDQAPSKQEHIRQMHKYIYHKHSDLYQKYFFASIWHTLRHAISNPYTFRCPHSDMIRILRVELSFWPRLVIFTWVLINKILDQVRIKDRIRWIKRVVLKK